ncbi:MAG TPA: DUF2225 domain-containing protein [Clostridiales bacterium]|nr:DUF2225 domain-containing protein [Clostridiales bacterium]
MTNLFSGLEEFGFDNISNLNIYEDKKEKVDKKVTKEKEEVKIYEEDFIFDKTFKCPSCDTEFKSKFIKTGRVKLLSLDTDLRPRYQDVDSLKYDVVVCPSCGYAAITRYFTYLTRTQIKLVREQITSSFRGIKNDESTISYDDAIIRHKLALVSAIVKKGKTSERAYTCLKLAWLLRGKRETLPENTPDYKDEVKVLEKEETAFIMNAYQGFKQAFAMEPFPMSGMDEITVTLLVAELARRTGNNSEAARWISKILISREANDRIKDRAREIKDLLVDNKE